MTSLGKPDQKIIQFCKRYTPEYKEYNVIEISEKAETENLNLISEDK